MYRYDEFDAELVNDRAEQFRRQTARRLAGELTEEQFRPLRLMNGLYLQLPRLHAAHQRALRRAVDDGSCASSRRSRETTTRATAIWTTRQNVQLNWIQLQQTPDLLKELASVEMHCIQSSGNCIRNTTADEYAGVAADEIEDPRVYAELDPPVVDAPPRVLVPAPEVQDRPDRLAERSRGGEGARHRPDHAPQRSGPARLRGDRGRRSRPDALRRQDDPEVHRDARAPELPRGDSARLQPARPPRQQVQGAHQDPGARDRNGRVHPDGRGGVRAARRRPPRGAPGRDRPDRRLLRTARLPGAARRVRRTAGEAGGEPRLRRLGRAEHPRPQAARLHHREHHGEDAGPRPGDMSSDQMEAVADLSDGFSFGELRVTHRQNLTLTDVEQDRLFELWERLVELDLATANHALISDIIACPGLDYCALANARSIPVAQEIAQRFEDLKRQKDVGPLELNISGCINACGHHHVGNIGILGVDRAGEELYQLQLGGCSREDASLADITGRGFPADKIADAVETVVDTYLDLREDGETFIDTYRRVGLDPFKQKLYDAA